MFHLSLCGNKLKKAEQKKDILRIFYENRVDYKTFQKDPQLILNDSNLLIKIDDAIYTYQLGMCILTCRLAFGR